MVYVFLGTATLAALLCSLVRALLAGRTAMVASTPPVSVPTSPGGVAFSGPGEPR